MNDNNKNKARRIARRVWGSGGNLTFDDYTWLAAFMHPDEQPLDAIHRIGDIPPCDHAPFTPESRSYYFRLTTTD